MNPHRSIGGRELKQIVAVLLVDDAFPSSLEAIRHLPVRQVVNPLFAFFCDANALRRWRAVSAMGLMVSRLAEENMESARVVMRRFMWNLNEESGGIGWGCPEAMGECMAASARLADEYACMLISYLDPGRNYIEHPALQEGVLWGVGRLAHARPTAMAGCVELLIPFLESPEAVLRGHAAWAAGFLGDERLALQVEKLVADRSAFSLYWAGRLEGSTVGAAAEQALQAIRIPPRKE